MEEDDCFLSFFEVHLWLGVSFFYFHWREVRKFDKWHVWKLCLCLRSRLPFVKESHEKKLSYYFFEMWTHNISFFFSYVFLRISMHTKRWSNIQYKEVEQYSTSRKEIIYWQPGFSLEIYNFIQFFLDNVQFFMIHKYLRWLSLVSLW